jgi:DNA invertase Pin-like site-specific DNA recombinase
MAKAKATALYLRVSSRKQDTASQEPDLKRWLAAHPGPARWYRDTFTGKTMDRPGFTQLWADVVAGELGAIVVWRLDRLGRTASGLTKLFEDLGQRKVNLVSIKDGIDLATPAGRLMANVLASVAAYENEVRSERVIAGQAVARAKGVRFGRPAGSGKPLKLTPRKRSQVVTLAAEGKPVAAIARMVELSRTTVYQVLNEA